MVKKEKKTRKTQKTRRKEQMLENYISQQDRDLNPNPETIMSPKPKDIGRKLRAKRIEQYQKCPECTSTPHVFLKVGKETIPVCEKDWNELAPTQISWSGSI